MRWIGGYMHILLIHQAFLTGSGAGGTRHYELAQHLIRSGHQVTAITSPVSYLTGQSVTHGDELASEQAGIEVRYAYTYRALHRSFAHRVISFLTFMFSSLWTGLRIRQVDIVWGTSPPIFQGLSAWALARLKGRPLVFEVRDLWPAFAVEMGILRNRVLIFAAERLEGFLYRQADHIIITSPAFVEHVQSKVRGKVPVTLIPHGVETGMFKPEEDGTAVRRELGLEDRVVVLYAGAHGAANDLGVVLEAAGLLRDREEIVFVLVGDGKEKGNLVRMAGAMALTNVLFVDAQPKSRMPDFLAAADAGLAILRDIPMFWTAYPNKVFDYMAAGRPTILAIDGIIRDVIEAAQGGIFAQPGDPNALAQAVRWLSDRPQVRREMGQSARSYVEAHFERQDQARKLEAVLEPLASRKGERA